MKYYIKKLLLMLFVSTVGVAQIQGSAFSEIYKKFPLTLAEKAAKSLIVASVGFAVYCAQKQFKA